VDAEYGATHYLVNNNTVVSVIDEGYALLFLKVRETTCQSVANGLQSNSTVSN